MNAGFGIFRKLFPDIRERMKPDKPLSRELELVLNSKGETSLTGVSMPITQKSEIMRRNQKEVLQLRPSNTLSTTSAEKAEKSINLGTF